MNIKSTTFFLTCLLLLSAFAMVAVACPPPYCGPCYTWNEVTEECDWDCESKECCTDSDCPDVEHYSCIDCECICDYDPYYTQNTPIDPVSITLPTDGESFCIGTEDVSATCTTSTDSDMAHHCVDNVWTVEPVSDPVTHTWSGPGTFDPTTGTSVTWTPPNTAGEYTITVTASDSPKYDDSLDNPDPTDSITVYVVEVDQIQYNDPDTGWTYIQPSPAFALYVYKGTTVTFKAIPDPCDASWPSGKPVWGGSSGASGTGETTAVTFNTLSSTLTDYKTVTATCGNTITIYVIVFDFEGVFAPKDDFDGRHTMYYGIKELVELSFETDPWSVPAGQAGGLEWTKNASGPGTLSDVDIDYGTAEYDAGATNGTVWLILTIKSGPSKGKWEGYQKDVILPSGTQMTRATANVKHDWGDASAGIALYYWLDPTHVSFKYLTFGEDSCPATGKTGIYLTAPPGNHPQNTFGAILGGNSTTGCRVQKMDGAWSSRNPWALGGTYTWSIPTQYIDDTSTRNTFGSNQNQVPVLQANGDATMNKGGQSGSAALNDLTSGW